MAGKRVFVCTRHGHHACFVLNGSRQEIHTASVQLSHPCHAAPRRVELHLTPPDLTNLLATTHHAVPNRQQAAEEQAKAMVAGGQSAAALKNAGGAGAGAIKGVGLARAAGVGGVEMEEAAEDERYLRKVNRSFIYVRCLVWRCPSHVVGVGLMRSSDVFGVLVLLWFHSFHSPQQ